MAASTRLTPEQRSERARKASLRAGVAILRKRHAELPTEEREALVALLSGTTHQP